MTFGKIGTRKMIYKWKNPYIINGLVAMWDGDWNVEGGNHNATIENEWTDSIGGRKAVAIKGTTSFGDNHLIANNAVLQLPFGIGDLVSLLNTGKFTIEWLQYHTDSRGYVFSNDTETPAYQIWDNVGLGMYLRLYGSDNYGNVGYGKGALANRTTHMVYTVDAETGVYGYVNGVQTKSANAFASAIVERTGNARFYLIGRPQYDWMYFNGRMYFIRLYNRPLAPNEIAHNYMIDKARFNLP